jgi:superfamily I DNA/RNA helicase
MFSFKQSVAGRLRSHDHTEIMSDSIRHALTQNLSEEQKRVFDLPLVGPGLNVCAAVPGSGKSTTLGKIVARAVTEGVPVLVLTSTLSSKMTAENKINVSLAEVNKPKIPGRQIRTLHSVAFGYNKSNNEKFELGNVKPFMHDSFDAFMDEPRLKAVDAKSWTEYWERESSRLTLLELDKFKEANVDTESENIGLLLYKHLLIDKKESRLVERADFCASNIINGNKPVHPVDIAISVRETQINNLFDSTWTTSGLSLVISDAQRNMREADVADHTDSIARYAQSARSPIGKGGVLVIDECQDATAQQVIIITTAISNGARVVLFGDPNQGIFRFAGSSNDPMSEIVKHANTWGVETHTLSLTHNFRSTAQITTASMLALPTGDRRLMHPHNSAADGAPVVQLLALDREHQYVVVRDEIKRQINLLGRSPGDIAVIRRQHFTHSEGYAKALSCAGIAYCIVGAPDQDVTHPICRTLSILNVLLSGSKIVTVSELQTAVRAVHGCSFSDEVAKIVSEVLLEKGDCTALSVFLDKDEMVSNMNERVRKKETIKKRKFKQQTLAWGGGGTHELAEHTVVTTMLKSISTFQRVKDLVDEWVDATLYDRPCVIRPLHKQIRYPNTSLATQSSLGKFLLNVFTQIVQVPALNEPKRDLEFAPLLRDADSHHVLEDILEFEEFVSLQLQRFIAGKEDEQVVMSTIHKFKGRERDVVIVCEVDSRWDAPWVKDVDKLPFASLYKTDVHLYYRKIRQLAEDIHVEDRRLLHVALSRPRKELILCADHEFATFVSQIE